MCVWLDSVVLHGYNKRVTEVYHLMARHQDASEDQKKVAKIFKSIRLLLKKKQFSVASEALAECASDPLFGPYKLAIGCLDEHCIQESFHPRRKAKRATSSSNASNFSRKEFSRPSTSNSNASSVYGGACSSASGNLSSGTTSLASSDCQSVEDLDLNSNHSAM